jgi:hypothetical protein
VFAITSCWTSAIYLSSIESKNYFIQQKKTMKDCICENKKIFSRSEAKIRRKLSIFNVDFENNLNTERIRNVCITKEIPRMKMKLMNHKCKTFEKIFSCESNFKRHLSIHDWIEKSNGKKYENKQSFRKVFCTKFFSSSSLLFNHKKRMNSSRLKMKKHVCDSCGSKFINNKNLKSHVRLWRKDIFTNSRFFASYEQSPH